MPAEEILGEKIECDGRKITGPAVYMRSGARRGQRVVVKGDPARCIVMIPWLRVTRKET
jgi:hypothetical protein